MALQLYTVALNNTDTQTLIPAGTVVGSFTVLQLPAGVMIVASVGGSSAVPLWFVGQVVRFCGGNQDGITVQAPAGLTGVLVVCLNMEQENVAPSYPFAPGGSYLGGAVFTSAGNAAGQVSVLQLVNPVNSGVSLLIRAAGITVGVGTVESLRVVSVLQAGNPTASNITATMPGMPAAKAVWKAANAIVAAGGITPAGFLNMIGGSGLKAELTPLPRPLLVPPGSAVEHAGSLGTNGANLFTSIGWDEV